MAAEIARGCGTEAGPRSYTDRSWCLAPGPVWRGVGLEGERTRAGLAAGEGARPADDAVGARCVREQLACLERAARGDRALQPAEDGPAVLDQRDPPTAANAVLVDLELRLETAVVELRLQLPGARARARASLDDLSAFVATGERAGSESQ